MRQTLSHDGFTRYQPLPSLERLVKFCSPNKSGISKSHITDSTHKSSAPLCMASLEHLKPNKDSQYGGPNQLQHFTHVGEVPKNNEIQVQSSGTETEATMKGATPTSLII